MPRTPLTNTAPMAHNEALTQRVRGALANVPKVEKERIFRGIAFLVNGKMCVSTGDNELLCRVDPAQHDELAQRKGCQATLMKGRAYKGYLCVKETEMKPQGPGRMDGLGAGLPFGSKPRRHPVRSARDPVR
jgi:TfoX/Sxy family transcriptional regulator of competence genes